MNLDMLYCVILSFMVKTIFSIDVARIWIQLVRGILSCNQYRYINVLTQSINILLKRK